MKESLEVKATTSASASPAVSSPGLWRDLREGIFGTQQDFTEGSIGRAITLLAIPMVLEMAMESVFGIVDVFFVGRLGADAVATVGITESLLTLVFAVAMGLSMATTAMVARRIGEKDPTGAALAAVQAIAVRTISFTSYRRDWILADSVAASPDGCLSWHYRHRFRLWCCHAGRKCDDPSAILAERHLSWGGDAVIAMRSLWFANLVNIILDPCFIFGYGPFPEMGVTGAAVATNIGRGLGVAYQLFALWRGRGRVRLSSDVLRLDPKVMLRLVRVSLGGIFQFLIATASWLGLVRIIAFFGSSALAGYTIALRIIIFAVLPSWGMSNAAATLVGQNLGAGKPERAEKSVWRTGLYNMLFLGGVAVIFIVFAEPLVRIFTSDPAVVPIGTACLRYVSYGYGFYAYGMVMVQAFNGAGDTATPTKINLFCYWLFEIPLAYVLAIPAGLGVNGVFLAITIAESTIAVVGILAFRRGRWKERKI